MVPTLSYKVPTLSYKVPTLSYKVLTLSYKVPTLSYRDLIEDMIETSRIVSGVYDGDVVTGLLNLRIDSNIRSQQNKILK